MARLQQQGQAQNLGSLEHRDSSLPVSQAAKFPIMEKDSNIDVYLLSVPSPPNIMGPIPDTRAASQGPGCLF